MHQLDHYVTAAGEASADTEELAVELAEKKLDTFRIRWLIEDRGADIMRAISIAHLNEHDLLKNPALKPLGLHKYMHTRH